MGTCIVNEIPDDQKIVNISHTGNHRELIVKPLTGFGGDRMIAFLQSGLAKRTEHFLAGFPVRRFEAGKLCLAKGETDLTAHGDFMGSLYGLAQLREQGMHFLFALDIQLVGVLAHPLFIIQRLSGLNAHQNFLSGSILPGEVMTVIGDNHGDAGIIGQADQQGKDPFFIRQTMVHELNKEISLSENLFHCLCMFNGSIIPAIQQQLIDAPGKTGGAGNQSFMVLFECFQVYAWPIIISANPAVADQLNEVLIPRLIFA